MNDYILGTSGEQVTEMGLDSNNSLAWQHTNVYAAGKLLATYDQDGLHFYLDDPLGTRRAQTDYAGLQEQTCRSLPFGDGLACTGSTQYPAEQHFTGKERDAESGNDYFGARYYASSMGRFMSPDSHAGTLSNPQTLNRYSYGMNNPLIFIDPTGNDCVYAGSSAATSTIVRGDCISDSDSGVFVDGHVSSITDNADGNSATIHYGDYIDANNHYDNPLATSMANARALSGDPWGGHAFAQQLFQGAGSGSFVAANTAVNYAAGGYALLAGGAVFAPEIAAGAGAAASWGASASGLLGSTAGRVFWSAIGAEKAAEWAAENGGGTLEMSPLGGFANWAQGFLPQNGATGAAWNALSSAFASGARGGVTYLQGAYLGNTWLNTELPIFQQNGNPISTVPAP